MRSRIEKIARRRQSQAMNELERKMLKAFRRGGIYTQETKDHAVAYGISILPLALPLFKTIEEKEPNEEMDSKSSVDDLLEDIFSDSIFPS